MYRLGYDDINESFTHREQVQVGVCVKVWGAGCGTCIGPFISVRASPTGGC